MKILLVGPYRDDPGGVAAYYNAVLPRLSEDGVLIDYLEIGTTLSNGRWLHKLNDQCRFWRALNQFDPDIVHINPQLDLLSFVRDGLFVLAAKYRGKPVLVFYHGWRVSFEGSVHSLLLWFFRVTYGRSDAFVVLAKHFSTKLQAWGICVPIHRGFTAVEDHLLDSFSLDQKCGDIRKGCPLKVLFLARLVERKGLFEFLEGFRLLGERGVDARATVAGDGPLMGALIQHLNDHDDLRQRVDVIGYVSGETKARVLREHHVFCFPTSYPEGLPTALLEAMALGMGVITCPAGGIADFFDHGQMGVTLAGPDPRLICDGMELLLSDRDELVSIARHNHQYARSRFLASEAARFLRSRYSELMSVIS